VHALKKSRSVSGHGSLASVRRRIRGEGTYRTVLAQKATISKGFCRSDTRHRSNKSKCPIDSGGAFGFLTFIQVFEGPELSTRATCIYRRRLRLRISRDISMMTFGNMHEIGVRTLAPLLFVTSLLAEPVHAQSLSQQDWDLSCAIASGAEMGANLKGSAEQNTATMIFAFYLGRLTARDDKTYWNDVIRGRIVEMRERARSMTIYTRCTDFYLSQIK
jgi:hypothetical protein